MPQFSLTNGLRRAILAKTRQEFRQNNVMLSLLDTSEESRFQSEGNGQIVVQRRGATSDSVVTGVNRANPSNDAQNPRGSVGWGAKNRADASEITVAMRSGISDRFDIPRLDQRQSPRNEVEDFRRRISANISEQFEADVVEFFQSDLQASTPLTGLNGQRPSGTATHNGNAGSISQVNVGKRDNSDSDYFNPATLRRVAANSDSTLSERFMLDIIDDIVLWAKRSNLIDGQALYGDVPATLYLVVHPELFQFALLKQLAAETSYRLEPLGTEILTRSSAFGQVPFSGRLGLQNLTILAPNSLRAPANSKGQEWVFWAGYTAGAIGGIADDFSRIWTPEQNPEGDGYDLFQKIHPFYNAVNGDAFRRYTLLAHADQRS